MAQNDTLTPKKRRAIAALLEARTVEDAADLAGIARRTLFRWLQDDSFALALRAAEGEMIGEAVRALIADLRANHETMRGIRDDQENSESVRLRASQALDASLLRWREILNVDQRLADLEAAVYGKHK